MSKFTILTWYDTITPESAENGDYESTGNEERSYSTDNIFEAARIHASLLNDMRHFEINAFDGRVNWAGEVATATDPDVDSSTGAEDYTNVAVMFKKSVRLRSVYNRLVDRAINRLERGV